MLVLGGCTDGGGGDTDDRAPAAAPPGTLAACEARAPAGPVAVTLAHTEGEIREDALTALVADFERGHPTVDVRLERVADGAATLMARWADQRPADRPALALLPQRFTARLVDSGQTVAPGPCLAAVVPDMLPAVAAAWSIGGRLRAVPLSVSTPVLLYDRAAFREAGLDPDDPPATLSEVRAAAERVVGAGAAGVGLVVDTGVDSGGSWFVEQWAAQAGELSLRPDNGRGGRAERVAWDEGPAAERLAWLHAMIEDGLAVSVGRNTSGLDDLYRSVDEGSPAAMTIHTSGSLAQVIPAVRQLAPDLELGVAPLPGPGAGSLPGGSALWLAAGQPPDEAAAAWLLASYLASPAVDARWAAATGYVPLAGSAGGTEPLRSVWSRHPGLAVAHDVLAHQGNGPAAAGPVAGPAGELRELLAGAVEEALTGHDPDAALAAAADDADRLLAAYDHGAPGAPG